VTQEDQSEFNPGSERHRKDIDRRLLSSSGVQRCEVAQALLHHETSLTLAFLIECLMMRHRAAFLFKLTFEVVKQIIPAHITGR
jgi:hypothetical protein